MRILASMHDNQTTAQIDFLHFKSILKCVLPDLVPGIAIAGVTQLVLLRPLFLYTSSFRPLRLLCSTWCAKMVDDDDLKVPYILNGVPPEMCFPSPACLVDFCFLTLCVLLLQVPQQLVNNLRDSLQKLSNFPLFFLRQSIV